MKSTIWITVSLECFSCSRGPLPTSGKTSAANTHCPQESSRIPKATAFRLGLLQGNHNHFSAGRIFLKDLNHLASSGFLGSQVVGC